MSIKISICIPTYNRSDLLRQTLRSVQRQTVLPFEVLVVDNCSTDDTPQVVKEFDLPCLRYVRNKKNLGMVGNWNECVKQAKGNYLTFLHSDDLIAPDWYQSWVSAIAEAPKNCKFFQSSLAIIDANNNLLQIYHTFPRTGVINQPGVIQEFSRHLSPNFAPTAVNIYHRSIFDEIGLFDLRLGTEADVLHSLKIMNKYDVFYLKKAIFCYRSHQQQGFDIQVAQKTEQEKLKRKARHWLIIKKFFEKNLRSRNQYYPLIQYSVLMTLSPLSLFLIKGEKQKVNSYFKLASSLWPDFFTKPSNLYLYWKVLLIFVWRELRSLYLRKFPPTEFKFLKSLISSQSASHI